MTLRRYQPLKPSRGTTIPAKVRAAVHARDGRECLGPKVGMPGECFGAIELDHILPGGMGRKSPSTVEGLASLCSTHHRMRTLEGRKYRPLLLAYLTTREPLGGAGELNYLTIEGAEERLAEIERVAGDDEHAHSLEDALYVSVLQAVAGGSPDAKRLAEIALSSQEIEFTRWYA